MSVIGNPILIGTYENVSLSVSNLATVQNTKLILETGSGGIDTSDATLTSGAHMLYPYTAYSQGIKYTGSITTRSASDLTASGATVTVPAGHYASQATKAVASGSATINSSISVTPSISVNSSTGLITASVNGSVGANPVVTEGYVSAPTTGTISYNGSNTSQLTTQAATTITPTTSSQIAVAAGKYTTGAVTVGAIPSQYIVPSGSQTITQNGTVDVTSLAQIVVNVAGSGGLTYETGTYTPSSNIARPTINWTNTHSEAPVLVFMSDATGTAHSATNSNYVFCFADPYKLWGSGFPYSSSGFRYAMAWYEYRGNSTSSISTGGTIISNNSDSTTSSDTSYPRYWVSPTGFYPYSNSTSRYWRSGRTYKWIAVWKP